MRLRPPEYSDYGWMVEAYKDWPKGITTAHDVAKLLRRWIERGDPVCLVAELNEPVGLMTYRQQFFGVWIHNLLVRPEYRYQGHSKTMLNLLKAKLVADGAMVAGFKPLDGPYKGRYPDDRFTWNMEI